jgi:hypothetical protein
LCYVGESQAARDPLDRVEDRLPDKWPSAWGRWVLLTHAVEGLHVLGEHSRAGDLYPVMAECIERTAVVCLIYFDGRLLQRAAGIAAHSAGRFDDAERHFRTALRQAADLPHLPEQAHTNRFYARMLIDRDSPGDRTEAARLAARAGELYRRMGMPRHLAMVENLI